MGAQGITGRIETGDIGLTFLVIGNKAFGLVDGHSR